MSYVIYRAYLFDHDGSLLSISDKKWISEEQAWKEIEKFKQELPIARHRRFHVDEDGLQKKKLKSLKVKSKINIFDLPLIQR